MTPVAVRVPVRWIVTAAMLAVAAGMQVSGAASALWNTDGAVRWRVISDSLRDYHGPCPCPYSPLRRWHVCGEDSAYSKPGGSSPLCYPSDVTDAMLREFRHVSTID
jgi:hypothetical protein